MKLKINEVAKLTGVTVRTLHHYDDIGLLHPSEVTEAGYRLYDEKALMTMQQILFFRELDFSLNQIKEIINNPAFDATSALNNHKALLIKKRERIDKLIELVEKTVKGSMDMSFKEFDMAEIEAMKEKYASEVKEKWGTTSAYIESEKRTRHYDKAKWQEIQNTNNAIFGEFAANMNNRPESPEVQRIVKRWQDFLSDNFYDCSKEMLKGLGQMYIADPRFTKNIDKQGEGLALFISEAIDFYCTE